MTSAADSPSIVVRAISAAETRPLRQQLLRPHMSLEQLVYRGDDETDALHAGAFRGETHLGIASIFPQSRRDHEDANAWRIRGMAMLPSLRSQGVGGQLLTACIEHAKRSDGALVWCTARVSAMGFYERHGFRREGKPFEIPHTGPHYVMVLRL